ncbi:protein FAR1-RELATED SEQUENCE 6-like isoform X2 [Primulina huaijiensis]|uniref:protein FAR1-RELATED SEQUENCE 6-like isoform X2 n=1 Tax=Primulina huaijiensis TaxID=1492673 RepID=UPI003CC71799
MFKFRMCRSLLDGFLFNQFIAIGRYSNSAILLERSSQFCMEETLFNTEKVSDGVGSDNAPEISDEKTAFGCKNGILEGDLSHGANEFVTLAIGMEFDSYDDAYNYYNCYAREAGFSVRVKNSWFKRNSREKYGAVLCCSSQGFKRAKDVNRLRKETRTGCPAMMRMRLVDSKRWRILEVTLEHNHLLGAKGYKCSKKMGSESKKNLLSKSDLEVQPVKLYQAVVIDAGGDETSNFSQTVAKASSYRPNQLNLRKGDAQAMYNYLCRLQLTNSNFFYLMDLNDDGRVRNVIWVDAKSRAASSYFSDVIYFDNSCLSNKYEVPLVAFVGINNHGQSVLLGCGLLSGENKESYTWLFKAWISCTSVNSPETIISDRCKILQSVVADVFPKSLHRFSLSLIMQKVPEKLGGLRNYDDIKKSLLKGVYETLKPFDFEAAWRFMIQQFRIMDNEWLWSLYEDRAQWATVYLKDTFFMGMAAARPCETMTAFFDKYVHKQTPLKEFLDKYELALQKKHKEEVLADMESRNSSPKLKTRCSFELQLSKVYTRDIFRRFQLEVEEMYSCFGTTQLHVDGPITIFLVKERIMSEGNRREIRDYEVLYNVALSEVRCICSCFNFYGYLCRHALCVLNFNGVEEIPSKYILSRWKKDYKRLYMSPDQMSGGSHITEQVEQFTQLYRSALKVVEEGMISLDHYKAAMLAFEESLDKIYSVEEK